MNPQPARPDNLLGLDYRNPPPRRLPGLPIVDSHVHLRGGIEAIRTFFDAATTYGIHSVVSMTFLEFVDEIERAFPGRAEFIAIPDYRTWERTAAFQRQWQDDIRRFATRGAKVAKFWAAPRALAERGMTLDDPWLRPIIDTTLDAGLAMMVHVADPDLWFATRYADSAVYGTKAQAYERLEWLLQYVAPRPVIGAHFLGDPEHLDHLDSLLRRYPHLMLDCSATKWVGREISRYPLPRVHQFFGEHRSRILFGSDLVIDPIHDFEHYASRYWVHQMLWETDYRGESPIEDPDVEGGVAHIRGTGLADDVLQNIYFENRRRLMASLPASEKTHKST